MRSFTPTKVKHSLTMERVTGSNTKKMGRLCFVDLFSKTGMRSNKPAHFLGDKCDLDKSPNLCSNFIVSNTLLICVWGKISIGRVAVIRTAEQQNLDN